MGVWSFMALLIHVHMKTKLFSERGLNISYFPTTIQAPSEIEIFVVVFKIRSKPTHNTASHRNMLECNTKS